MSSGRNSQPPQESTNPPDLHSETRAVRGLESAVRALETHREHMTTVMEGLRIDHRDARDRIIRIEEKVGALNDKVGALPTKAWIGTVVVSAMGFFGAVIAAAAAVVHFFVR